MIANSDTARLVGEIELGSGSLDPSTLSMGTLMRELSLSRRPTWLLGKLMSALEEQRISKKIGWSRPWKKEGMTVFRSLKHSFPEDQAILNLVQNVLLTVLNDELKNYRGYVEELLVDKRLMAFSFYHNHFRDGDFHEGLTLSIGRKVVDDRTKRDRIDIILEDWKQDNQVDGRLDRVRIFINPWHEYRNSRYLMIERNSINPNYLIPWQSLYDVVCAAYMRYKDVPERQFEHWSIRLIDYFGSRKFIPYGSRFL